MRLGKYQHFKGGIYEVLFEAIDSETAEPVVVYRNVDSGHYWVRPRVSFLASIMVEANDQCQMVPRFKFIGDD